MANDAPRFIHLNLEDEIAVITLDRPPVNSLTVPLLEQLIEAVHKAQAMTNAKAIVIHGANGRFSAGMDLIEVFSSLSHTSAGFAAVFSGRDQLNNCFNLDVEGGVKPTVAAVERVALGGGMELAVACNGIIATPRTVLGWPEVRVGIVPDFGGIQRALFMMNSPSKALELLAFGKKFHAEEAQDWGIVDEVVDDAEQLLKRAKAMALDMAEGRKPRRQPLKMRQDDPGWRKGALEAVESMRKRTIPLSISKIAVDFCLDCAETGIKQGPLAGMKKSKSADGILSRQLPHRAAVRAFAARHNARHARGMFKQLALHVFAWILASVALISAAATHLMKRQTISAAQVEEMENIEKDSLAKENLMKED